MSRMSQFISSVTVLLITSPAIALADPPPIFDTRSYAQAKSAAEAGKKWFIVKATADWCVPCKQMDKTTWRDEKVVKWLKEQAVLVAVDVDKQKDVAKQLEIRAMPTMIAFRGGAEEFDRQQLRDTAGTLYASLLAGDEDAAAKKLAEQALEYDDSPKMIETIVSTALRAKELRHAQIDLLKKIEAPTEQQAELMKRLQKALEQASE